MTEKAAQPFSPEDVFLHHRVSQFRIAPVRPMLACTVQWLDREQDRALSCLWAFALDGDSRRQLTRGPGVDNNPRWSPDGNEIAFVSDRGGSPQLYLLPFDDGGEARPLATFDGSVSDFRWVPSSRTLLVASAVSVDPDWRGERPHGRRPARGKAQPEVCWKLPYKSDGIGYLLAREIHLFTLDIDSGVIRQVTDGAFDVLGFDPSPDARRIAYVRTREGRFAHRSDLWVCDADGSHPCRLTKDFATVAGARWSPDGKWIAFCASLEDGDAQTNPWRLEVASGKLHRIGDADTLVDDPESLHWLADGDLVFTQAHRGRDRIVRANGDGELQALVAGDRQLGGIAAGEAHLAFQVVHPSRPSEASACRLDGSDERTLSDFNPWWKERTPISAECKTFEVPDGRGGMEKIEGWLMRAEGRQGPMPVLDDVHGGPASYALLDFESAVYWHVLCSQGWAVLALNSVGSAGYGREFCERLAGHWGVMDLPQHMAAMRQLVEEGIADERQAISGKSYGGFLTAWAIGHSRRFRSAVVMAPVGNIETHYGTSDGGYYADPYYMGTAPKFDRDLAAKLSPLKSIEQATTPTLFMQGKDDERCPKCQSEELFVSLTAAGDTPTELVMYAGEGHSFLTIGAPAVREDAARRIVDWLARHIDSSPTATTSHPSTHTTGREEVSH